MPWIVGLLCSILPLTAVAADPLAATVNPPWTTEKAAHLLRRAGFGGSAEQIRHLSQMGRDQAVDLLVDYESTPQDDPDYPIEDFVDRPPRGLFAGLGEERGRELGQMIERVGRAHGQSMQDWWLRRMVVTQRPLEEKMTLYWHGHFTSGIREVRSPQAMYRQNQFLREHALSDFKTLLRGISRDEAMLIYLDNGKNVKAHPNENYARELMELFTLGEGNYTEQDVKEAARAFTGWTAGPEGFHVRPRQHDDGEKEYLGRKGNFDGDDIINIILEQPATARFLARKLWVFFVTPNPDDATIDALAARLRAGNYDIREAMRTILRSDAFYSSKARMALIKSPTELIVGSARLLETPLYDLRTANQQMQQMGQQLFQPPNVKGWDGGRAWINTSTLFIRYNTMAGLLNGTRGDGRGQLARQFTSRLAALGIDVDGGSESKKTPALPRLASSDKESDGAMTDKDGEMMASDGEMSGMGGAPGDWPEELKDYVRSIKMPPDFSRAQVAYDPTPVLEKHKLTTAEAIVDYYVKRLLQMSISSERKAVLVQTLNWDDAGIAMGPDARNERIRRVIHLIMSMPEYQLN